MYIEDATFIEIYKHYILIITAENKIIILNVHKKEKVLDSFLNFNVVNNPMTKISSIKFLDLDRIIIYVDTFNIFKNTNIKNILLYDRNLNQLIQLDNGSGNSEIENMVLNTIQENKSILSQYNYLFNDPSFFILIEQISLISEKDEKKVMDNVKINANLKSLEEKLIYTNILNQKNEFVQFLDKYLYEMIRSKVFYKLMDFFVFYFNNNEKEIFQFLVNYY
jgi:hypothetical protein